MPNTLAKLWDMVFPDRAHREHRATLKALTEQRDKALRKVREAYDYADTLISDWEREREFLRREPGYRNDKKDGDNWPYLANMEDLRHYRGMSRAACEGNGYGAGMLDRAVDFVIGEGMMPTVTLRGAAKGAVSTGVADADGDGRPDADPRVEEVQSVVDEFRRLNDWGCGEEDREEEGFRRSQRDGEVFVRFFRGGAETNGIPRVRWVEPEQVDAPPSNAQARWGITTAEDDIETRETYHVYSLQSPGKCEDIPASEIVHHKLGTDRTVLRGMPQFWLVASALSECDKLNSAVTEVSAIQAQIAYVREHAPGVMPGQITDFVGGTGDGQGRRVTPYGDKYRRVGYGENGTVVDMSAGMKFSAGPVSQGVSGFVSALQSRLRQVCARFGYPEFFTSDASNGNYASLLAAGGPTERNFKRRQMRYAAFQAAVYHRACEYAVRSGRLSAAALSACEIVVKPGKVAVSNNLEEAQIDQILLQNKVKSVQTVMAERGLDPRVELANIKAFDDQFGTGGMGLGGGFGGDDGGGDGDGFGGGDGSRLLDATGESYTQEEYELLSEAQRGLLVKKTGTDSMGRKYTRWVAAGGDVGGKAGADVQRAQMIKPGKGVKGGDDVKAKPTAPKSAKSEKPKGDADLSFLPKNPSKLTVDQAERGLKAKGYEVVKTVGGTGHPDDVGGTHVRTPDGEDDVLTPTQVKRVLYGDAALPKAATLRMTDLSRLYRQAGGGSILGPAEGEPLSKPKAYRVKNPDGGGEIVVTAGDVLKAVVKAGLARESYSEWQYETLSEADRSGLVRKVITNSRGQKQVVWVRAYGDDRDAGTKTRQQVADARALVAKAVADPNSLTPNELAALAEHLETVSRDEIRGLLKQVGEKVGGAKVDLANRLVEKVRAGRTGGVGSALARGDTPIPNPRNPAPPLDTSDSTGNIPLQPTQSAGASQGVKKMDTATYLTIDASAAATWFQKDLVEWVAGANPGQSRRLSQIDKVDAVVDDMTSRGLVALKSVDGLSGKSGEFKVSWGDLTANGRVVPEIVRTVSAKVGPVGEWQVNEVWGVTAEMIDAVQSKRRSDSAIRGRDVSHMDGRGGEANDWRGA